MNRTGHHFSTNDFKAKLAHMSRKRHPIEHRIYTLMGQRASSCTIRRGRSIVNLQPGATPCTKRSRSLTITWRWGLWLSVTLKLDRKEAQRRVRAIDGGVIVTAERTNLSFRLFGIPYQPPNLHNSTAGAALVTQVRHDTATAPTTVSVIRGLMR